MSASIELKQARVITRADAKQFYKEVKSVNDHRELLKEYARIVARRYDFSKQLPLDEIDKATAKIVVVEYSKYDHTALMFDDAPVRYGEHGNFSRPQAQPWTIVLAKRINPPLKMAGHIAEGVSELVAGALTLLGASITSSPVVAWSLLGPGLTAMVYGVVNPITKIKATRSKNLQDLANALETAIIEALESVSSEQGKQ